jgi:DNA-binding NtrC family response regulator
VLILEDNPNQMHLLRQNIAGEGREILTADSLQEAKEHLKRDPDVVVADLRIEQQGEVDKEAGLKVLNLARAKDSTIQVILVSNYTSPDVSRKAMEEGAFDVLDRNPTGLDFWAMLRAKVRLALHYRQLMRREHVAT